MTPLNIIILIIAVLLIAIFFTMLGLGGGVLYTPIQVFLGIDFHKAVVTSLFLTMVGSLSALLVYRSKHKVDWHLVAILGLVASFGALLGANVSPYFSSSLLAGIFAAVAALAAYLMIRDRSTLQTAAFAEKLPFPWKRNLENRNYTVPLLIVAPGAFLAGVVSALIGVGGGIFIVPLLVILSTTPVDIAIGSSSVLVFIISAAGFSGHLAATQWAWEISTLLGASVFIGGFCGAKLSVKTPHKRLTQIFSVVLILTALGMASKI